MPRDPYPVSDHPCGFSLNLYADRIAYLAPYVEAFQDVFSSIINCDLGGYQATFAGNRGQIARLLATCRTATDGKIIHRLWPTTTTGFQTLVWGVLPKLTDEFAILELSLNEGTDGAGLKIHDGRDPETVYHRQEIVSTDFPLPSVTLYIQQNRSDWVVLLRSEY